MTTVSACCSGSLSLASTAMFSGALPAVADAVSSTALGGELAAAGLTVTDTLATSDRAPCESLAW
ncbi:hypothetical protein D3C78_1486600 [compost metagenome]